MMTRSCLGLWLLLPAFLRSQESLPPAFDARDNEWSFSGKGPGSDEFKLLQQDGDYLLIGARDAVYNVSIHSFKAETSIAWESTEKDVSVCRMKGNSKEACRNYIRVLAKESDGSILICGTNAFSPLCRIYSLDSEGTYTLMSEMAGNGICPYDPAHNSTALYVEETGELYAGTVADFAGKDPLVHRRRVKGAQQDFGLRTERNDIKCLNEPNFVGSLSWGGSTYFWLREEAVEYGNCGAAVYSRVARVCNADQGGPRLHEDTWTSFLKARLNCSLPGHFPFYFDEIESISEVVEGGGTRLVYAVFNTPYSAIRGSAVCAFRIEDIQRVFRESAFKSQASPDANWRPVHDSQVPKPRPSECSENTRQMSDEAVNFMIANPLMDQAIPNAFPQPILTHTGFKDRLTQIAVDAQVETVDGRRVDVLFVGTDRGRVLKSLNLGSEADEQGDLIEVLQVFEGWEAIRNLLVYRGPDGGSWLVGVSSSEVRRVGLERCAKASDCGACVALRDPYCAWHLATRACHARTTGSWPRNQYLQNIYTGKAECPAGDFVLNNAQPELVRNPKEPSHRIEYRTDLDEEAKCSCASEAAPNDSLLTSNASPKFSSHPVPESTMVGLSPAAAGMVSGSSLGIAVVLTLFVAASLGFLAGFQCSARDCLRRRKDLARTPSALSHHHAPNTLTPANATAAARLNRSLSQHTGSIHAYETRPRPPLAPDEVAALPMAPMPPDKNELLAEVNPFATLPKDYRVKKIYL